MESTLVRPALSVGTLARDFGDALATHKRELLTVVFICYAPALAADVLLTLTGSLPTVESAASMAVGSEAWWATMGVSLLAMAGVSFGVGAGLLVVLRGLTPRSATRASLKRWGGVLSIDLAGFLSLLGLAIPAMILIAIGTLVLGSDAREHVTPVVYAVGVIMFVPAVRTVLSLATAFAAMTVEGLRLRPALVRADELLKGNRLVAGVFFGGVVLVVNGLPTLAVQASGVRADGLVVGVVIMLVQLVAICLETTALAVTYRALVGKERGASDGNLAEVFE